MTLASELKMEKYYYFHFSLNFHSYRKSFTWLCILGVKWSHLKWYKLIYSISMEQNGVKAKEILLLVTIASCSFLIYQLTFCVQNSCISNSPYKMSACSGTVAAREQSSATHTGAQCHPAARTLPQWRVTHSFSE